MPVEQLRGEVRRLQTERDIVKGYGLVRQRTHAWTEGVYAMIKAHQADAKQFALSTICGAPGKASGYYDWCGRGARPSGDRERGACRAEAWRFTGQAVARTECLGFRPSFAIARRALRSALGERRAQPDRSAHARGRPSRGEPTPWLHGDDQARWPRAKGPGPAGSGLPGERPGPAVGERYNVRCDLGRLCVSGDRVGRLEPKGGRMVDRSGFEDRAGA